MNDQLQITELITPFLNNDEVYVVDIQVAGRQGGRLKVTILLDADAGITIEQCASISRQLGAVMDEGNFFGEDVPFILEVSSPGIDFPLKSARQFRRNIGRSMAVTFTDGTVQRGKLDEVTDNGILLDIELPKKTGKKKKEVPTQPEPSGPTVIAFENIKQAVVEIVFK
jgi:ribosome maturation factor RimP